MCVVGGEKEYLYVTKKKKKVKAVNRIPLPNSEIHVFDIG